MIRAGVGWSTHPKAEIAGQMATRQAIEQLDGAVPSWALLFGTVGHHQSELLNAVSQTLGASVEFVGCSAEGVITRAGSFEGVHAVCVLVVHAPGMRTRSYHIDQLSASPEKRGLALGLAIARDVVDDSRVLLLFPDGLTANGSEFLVGLSSQLPKTLPVIGGTAGDSLRFEKTYQYYNREVSQDSAVALLLSGDFEMEMGVSHGCDPVGLERTVTRAKDGYVLEIDGLPAWEVFKEYLDDPTEGLDALNVAHLSMAQRLELQSPNASATTLIRNPLHLDRERGALFFPGDLPSGTRLQIAVRNPERIRDHAVAMVQDIKDRRQGRKPSLVLHFDCAGRGRLLFGDSTNPMGIVPLQNVLGPDVPWVGFHTYGEIAPIEQHLHFHNYTVVLCAIYEPHT